MRAFVTPVENHSRLKLKVSLVLFLKLFCLSWVLLVSLTSAAINAFAQEKEPGDVIKINTDLVMFLGMIRGINRFVEETGGETLGASKNEVDAKLALVIDRLRARYVRYSGSRPLPTLWHRGMGHG